MVKNVVYVFTSCKRSGPIQIMLNLMANLSKSEFKPFIITLYDEVPNESMLGEFLSIGVEHYRCPLDKIQILLGKTETLKKLILSLNPSVIHSMGVFPDFAVSRMRLNSQMITLHNYMHDDYRAKFGVLKGCFLEFLQSYAIKKAKKVVTCSKSLSDIYRDKKNVVFDYIRNGIDTCRFSRPLEGEKTLLRKKLNLPLDRKIFVYSGQLIDRKNQEFLLKTFVRRDFPKNCVLLLLGDGPNMSKLKTSYAKYDCVIFQGNVDNVQEFLKASDFYISSSLSEGLPTGVLEALSCGLPVVLSDILQHIELFEIDSRIGFLFSLDNNQNCEQKIREILAASYEKLSEKAFLCAHEYLDARIMAKKYQEEYSKIAFVG